MPPLQVGHGTRPSDHHQQGWFTRSFQLTTERMAGPQRDLNCSESRVAETMLLSRYAQGDWYGGMFPLAPEVLEPVRRQLGVAHRVLDVLVAEPSL